MTASRWMVGAWALLVPVFGNAQNTVSLVALETYGTYEAAGVVATVSGDDNQNASAVLEWRPAGGPAYGAGHPLVRVDDAHFVGSLFWLEPGHSYDVRVTISDADGVSGSPTMGDVVATRPGVLVEPAARTLYVATTGSDGNPGTDPQYPLRTVQHAADLSQPGDLVSIEPGIYRESVSVPTSGTASDPIVFRGSAMGVVLDGADQAVANGVSWSAVGGGVYSHVTGFSTGHVVTDQGRLFRYDTLGELQTLGAGAPGGFFFDGTTLYVKLADGSSPASRQMHVARHEDGFYVDGGSHIRIENLELRHYGAGDYGKGVYLRYSSDCAVRSCRIHEVGSVAVWIKGGGRHLVEGNDLWDTSIFGWPWPYTKGSSAENNGVALTNDVARGNVIRDNRFWGTFNGISGCGSAPPPAAFTCETDIHDNTFSRHTDDALEPEGYCANVRMWGNVIEDVHMAFAVAPAAPGPNWIVRNVAHDFGNTRTSQVDGYTASALKINSGYSTPIGPLYLYHNTFLSEVPDTSALSLLNPGESTFITARNNLFAGTRYALSKVNPVVLDLDWDDMFTTDPTRFVYWEGARYADLAAFRAGTGQESSGIQAAPQLTAPGGGNFMPLPTSPLVDRGLVIAGINDGYWGSAPDIGAVEYAEAVFADGFESGDTTAWSITVGQ